MAADTVGGTATDGGMAMVGADHIMAASAAVMVGDSRIMVAGVAMAIHIGTATIITTGGDGQLGRVRAVQAEV